jgi:hypothetical protein
MVDSESAKRETGLKIGGIGSFEGSQASRPGRRSGPAQITTQFWLWFGIFLHLWLRQILNRFAYCHSQLCDMRLSESPMSETLRPRVKYVIGPDGSPLTIADLPPPSTRRWVIRRKAEVVAAVRGGLLSLEDACARYTLTVDEFLSWQVSIDSYGLAGLRTTRIQQYRH